MVSMGSNEPQSCTWVQPQVKAGEKRNNAEERPRRKRENTETAAAAAAKSLQSCPILCDPIDGSPPGSPVPGILQAKTLEWVAISFSNAWRWKNKVKSLSRVWLLATPWTAAHQAPPSMGFSRQESWSGVPLPSLKPETTILKKPCLQCAPLAGICAFWFQEGSHYSLTRMAHCA